MFYRASYNAPQTGDSEERQKRQALYSCLLGLILASCYLAVSDCKLFPDSLWLCTSPFPTNLRAAATSDLSSADTMSFPSLSASMVSLKSQVPNILKGKDCTQKAPQVGGGRAGRVGTQTASALGQRREESALSICSAQPTRPDRGWFVAPFGKNPWWVYLASILPALLVTILIFMDQQITAVIVNRKENKLRVRRVLGAGTPLLSSHKVRRKKKEDGASVKI